MASSVLHHDHFLPSFPAETFSTHLLVPFTDPRRSMNISTWFKYQMPTLNIPLESRHHQDAESRWLVKRHATLHYFMTVAISSLFSNNDFCFFTFFTALRVTHDRKYNVGYSFRHVSSRANWWHLWFCITIISFQLFGPKSFCGLLFVSIMYSYRSGNIWSWCKYQMQILSIPLESRHHCEEESMSLVKWRAAFLYFYGHRLF